MIYLVTKQSSHLFLVSRKKIITVLVPQDLHTLNINQKNSNQSVRVSWQTPISRTSSIAVAEARPAELTLYFRIISQTGVKLSLLIFTGQQANI